MATKEQYLINEIKTLTKNKPSGIKLTTLIYNIEYKAKREIDRASLIYTLKDLLDSGKIINLPRRVGNGPDGEKTETAFYRLAF